MVYSDSTVASLCHEQNESKVAAEERAESRRSTVQAMRAMLDRILCVMFLRVSGGTNILRLEPEPTAKYGERSVADIVSLFQSGVITREECRELVGNHFGKEW